MTDLSQSSIAAAFNWLSSVLVGGSSVVATLSVAYVGFLMLSGRIEVRRAGQVLIGCFILFGAPAIAGGIRASLLADSVAAAPLEDAADMEPSAPIVPQSMPRSYDPYAGASVGVQ